MLPDDELVNTALACYRIVTINSSFGNDIVKKG